jgi:hypothetical protein
MKSNTRILKFVALAALVAGSVPVASAAGLLGQRSVSGTYDWLHLDEPGIKDGRGFTLALNQPLSTNIDLGVSYSYLDSGFYVPIGEGETTELDVSGQELMFGATYYAPVQAAKVYGRVSAGWFRTNVAGDGDNDGLYRLEVGAEFAAGAKATLTPFITWENTFDEDLDHNGVWTYGALAEFEVATQWSLLAKATFDEDSTWGLSAGFAFRF